MCKILRCLGELDSVVTECHMDCLHSSRDQLLRYDRHELKRIIDSISELIHFIPLQCAHTMHQMMVALGHEQEVP